MKEKRSKGKVIHKHETEANWLLSQYVPDIGEVVFYDPDEMYSYTRQKNGDGIHKVSELPWAAESDWAQTDETQAGFIKNKPENLVYSEDSELGDATLPENGGGQISRPLEIRLKKENFQEWFGDIGAIFSIPEISDGTIYKHLQAVAMINNQVLTRHHANLLGASEEGYYFYCIQELTLTDDGFQLVLRYSICYDSINSKIRILWDAVDKNDMQDFINTILDDGGEFICTLSN